MFQLRLGIFCALCVAILAARTPAFATSSAEELKQETRIDEHLNTQLDLDLPLFDMDGRAAPLRQFIHSGRPVILVPVYYGCPGLCSFTLNGLLTTLNAIEERIGLDYTVVTYSINPDEKPPLAKEKSENYYQELKSPEDGRRGWFFLTADESVSKNLSQQIGFHYKRDGKDYIHASVFVILTPDGRVSRYFYGINPKARDVRFALVEASEGRFGTTFDRILLSCFRWDHLAGRYSFVAWNLVRYTSIAAVIVLFGLIISLRIRELKRRERSA